MAKQYKRINRFTSLPYVIDILATEQLTLTNPENWPDKNEKVTLKKYKIAKGAKQLFCLCMSDSEENIHLWSEFAPSECGCFIKFNYDKLVEFLQQQKDLVFSNMEYVKINDLPKFAIETEKLPFYKRHPFQPENEIRIIYLDYDGIKAEIKNNDVIAGIKKLKDQIKDLKKEVETAQSQTTAPIAEELIGDTKVIVAVVENGDLKKIVDDMKNANEKLAILLLQAKDDKVLIVAGSKNTNVKAGEWIKNIAPIVGGGGGGRPDFAQAGGKDVTKVEEAKIAALAYAKENL
jgi:hypothetical protein